MAKRKAVLSTTRALPGMKGMQIYGAATMPRPHVGLSDKALLTKQKELVKAGFSRELLDVNNEIAMRRMLRGGAKVAS